MYKTAVAAITLLFLGALAFSQEEDDLAKKIQNPVASIISVPFQNNTNFNIGVDERTQNILNIQPVWPVDLNPKWNLISSPVQNYRFRPGTHQRHRRYPILIVKSKHFYE